MLSQVGKGSPQSQTIERQCLECGQAFTANVIKLAGADFTRRYCEPCSVALEKKEEEERRKQLAKDILSRRDLWLQNSGLTGELRHKTFDNYEGGKETVKKAKEWAANFNIESPHGSQSLIFHSDSPGLGKTHLMAAITKYIIGHWHGDPDSFTVRRPIRFESGPGLVRRIRSTFNLPPDSNHEREEDVYNQLMGVRLLLLDDVGKETPSKFTKETYWYIIDERLKSGLPVIISTRLQLAQLEDLMGLDTVDRLYGMTKGEIITLKGTSYRRRHLKA